LKTSQATFSRDCFEKIPKNLSYFEEESCEIGKIFGGFGHIFSFFLLNCDIFLIGSSGLPTFNRIPRFFIFLFVL
jgi:hypothetical protein